MGVIFSLFTPCYGSRFSSAHYYYMLPVAGAFYIEYKSKMVFPPLPVSSNSRLSKAGIIGPGDRSYYNCTKKYKNKGWREKY